MARMQHLFLLTVVLLVIVLVRRRNRKRRKYLSSSSQTDSASDDSDSASDDSDSASDDSDLEELQSTICTHEQVKPTPVIASGQGMQQRLGSEQEVTSKACVDTSKKRKRGPEVDVLEKLITVIEQHSSFLRAEAEARRVEIEAEAEEKRVEKEAEAEEKRVEKEAEAEEKRVEKEAAKAEVEAERVEKEAAKAEEEAERVEEKEAAKAEEEAERVEKEAAKAEEEAYSVSNVIALVTNLQKSTELSDEIVGRAVVKLCEEVEYRKGLMELKKTEDEIFFVECLGSL